MDSAASPPPTLDAPASPKPAAATVVAATLTQEGEDLKHVAAHRAVEMVEPRMTLGLGMGSTAAHALDRLGDLRGGHTLGHICWSRHGHLGDRRQEGRHRGRAQQEVDAGATGEGIGRRDDNKPRLK